MNKFLMLALSATVLLSACKPDQPVPAIDFSICSSVLQDGIDEGVVFSLDSTLENFCNLLTEIEFTQINIDEQKCRGVVFVDKKWNDSTILENGINIDGMAYNGPSNDRVFLFIKNNIINARIWNFQYSSSFIAGTNSWAGVLLKHNDQYFSGLEMVSSERLTPDEQANLKLALFMK